MSKHLTIEQITNLAAVDHADKIRRNNALVDALVERRRDQTEALIGAHDHRGAKFTRDVARAFNAGDFVPSTGASPSAPMTLDHAGMRDFARDMHSY